MKRTLLGAAAALCVLSFAAALLLATPAQSQIQVAPSLSPVGVSMSGTTSTAWFHEPSSRSAVACQTVMQGSTLASIQCVKAALPN